MSGSWIDEEPGWRDALSELRRAASRARSRWLLTAFVVLVLTAAVVGYQAHKPRMYGATVVFRVTEGRFDPESAPPTSASLKDHIWNVSLSASRLLDIIKQHGLYPGRVRSDPSWAVEGMRDDLDVTVVRNFFSQERSAEDPPRSARLAISYRAEDPQVAHDVVAQLGSLVAEQQTEFRKLSANMGAEHARVITSRIRDELRDARTEQARLNMALATASPDDAPMIQLRLRDTMGQISALDTSLDQAERAAVDYDLRTAFEGQDMGLRFELVDVGSPPSIRFSRTGELAVFGLACLVVLLPFVVLGVGAFDSRVYAVGDVIRLGLEPFGHVPSFPGDRRGALPDRLAMNRDLP